MVERRGLVVFIGSLCGLACMAFAGAAGPSAPLEPRRLYLEAAVVDTTARPNLIGQPLDDAAMFVIQLDGPISPQRRAALAAAGVSLGDYLPQNAYIVRGADLSHATLPEFVAWVGEYDSAWKLSPEIGARAFVTDERIGLAQAGRARLDVTFFSGVDEDDAIFQVALIDDSEVVDVVEAGGHLIATLELPLAAAPQLADISAVQFVEEASEVTPRNSTTRWIVQSNQLNVVPLYDHGIHGEGQVVGVMDGRVDINHCSFSDSNPIGPSHRKILAYNTTLGADFHGTHVAGTAVGDAGNDSNTRGVAYMAKLVYGTSQSGANMNNALTLHHNQGARIHTNSWGNDGTTSYDTLCRNVDLFSYEHEDSLVLFAVTNTSTLRNPENAKNLLAVGASQDTPNQGNFCSGGVGPTSDGRRKPEIFAPGCNSNSAFATTPCSTTGSTGTSMASPAVAGAAALVRQYFTDGYYPTGVAASENAFTPSGALIKATVLNSGADMTGINNYPSNLEGWGRVQLDSALHFPGDADQLIVVDKRNEDGLSSNDVFEQFVVVNSSSPRLRVTLAWTDPPASAGASLAPVNDLDLEVVAPDLTLFRGNAFSGGFSTAGGSKDSVNNVEQVHVGSPAVGGWTVRVRAANVAVGAQGFALVVTGDVAPELPALTFSTPNGVPEMLNPAATNNFLVLITPGDEQLVLDSPRLHYRYFGGAFNSVPLEYLGHLDGEEWFQATLPVALCASTPEFYLSATGDGGTTVTLPAGAPAHVFTATVGVYNLAIRDDMEADMGWTVGAPDDTASSGVWTRVNPRGTNAAPEDDASAEGFVCWVTGQGPLLGGDDVADVDDGKSTLTSPAMDLIGFHDPTVSYKRWYNNSVGPNANQDVFLVQISDGGDWVTVEAIGPSGPETAGGWTYHEFKVGDYVDTSGTVRVRFVASDDGLPSIIEAGVDDFLVEEFYCFDPNCPGDLDSDNDVDLSDLATLLSHYGEAGGATEGDLNGDGVVGLEDLSALLSAYGEQCPEL